MAVTGASGFIGRHLVRRLVESGWQVRLLLRCDPNTAEWRDCPVQSVTGSLSDKAALERLVEGASAVIHVAGLIKATTRSGFFEVNRDGTETLAKVVKRISPQAHFLHLSSLAAREPQLSDYAASKRAGEDAALEVLGEQVTVLRPPAVYGPGDRETLVFFQLARHRFVPLIGPADARAAMIHVQDLVRLLDLLATATPRGQVLTASDARPEGYSWEEILLAAARAVGNERARLVRTPLTLLRAIALIGDAGRLLGTAQMLNSQKLRELRYPDWSVAPDERALPSGWSPVYNLKNGFADTAAWYLASHWLV